MVEYLDTNSEPRLPRAIIGLGENIKIGYSAKKIRESNHYQSIYSKEVSEDMVHEYFMSNSGDRPILIFSGGHTSGLDIPSEAEAMANYAKLIAKKRFNLEIPSEHILLEKNSLDTSTQAEILKKLTEGIYNVEKIVAVSFHTKRVRGIFKHFKFSSNVVAAESGVAQISEKHRKLMEKQTKKLNLRMWPDRFVEFGLNAARYVLFDPGQKRLRFLTKKSRSSQDTLGVNNYSNQNLKLQPIAA